MTDAILINNYLTKYYGVLIKDGVFCFQDKETKRVYTLSEFTVLFTKIFTYDLTDDLKHPLTLAQIWLDARKYEITEKVYDYLAGCRVKLGPQTWEVYDKNNSLVNEKIIRALGENGSVGMLYETIYNKWFNNEVYKSSTKMMGFYE